MEPKTITKKLSLSFSLDSLTRNSSGLITPTVRCQCTWSLSSLYKVPARKVYTEENPSAASLTTEQQQAVQTAAEALSQQQKLHIQHRHKKVATCQNSASSRGEGPSHMKGKAIDPQEWGSLYLNLKEVNMEAQAAALEPFKLAKEGHVNSTKKRYQHNRVSPKPGNRQSVNSAPSKIRQSRPAKSQLAAQIAACSYLGAALQNVSVPQRLRQKPEPSDSSSSTYSSSANDSLGSCSEESEGRSMDSDKRSPPHNQHQH